MRHDDYCVLVRHSYGETGQNHPVAVCVVQVAMCAAPAGKAHPRWLVYVVYEQTQADYVWLISGARCLILRVQADASWLNRLCDR